MKRFQMLIRTIYSDRPRLRFELLRYVARIVFPKYRFKWFQLSWWDDTDFNLYLNKFSEIHGLNTDRRWMLYQLRRLVSVVPGDTSECGAYRGAGSYMICKLNSEDPNYIRTHYIFDSFEGLSDPSDKDGIYWRSGDMSSRMEILKKNLEDFNISIHKGWIPDRFQDVKDICFSFVHIDVDLFEPTYESIAFFYPRMNPGGIIVCDDYGFTTCPGATEAINLFLKDKLEQMLYLPCGGGFLIKGCHTAHQK